MLLLRFQPCCLCRRIRSISVCSNRIQNLCTKNVVKKSRAFSEFRKLLNLAKPVRYRIAAGCGLLAISSAVSISVPFFMGKIIDGIFNPGDKPSISKIFSFKTCNEGSGNEEWHPPMVPAPAFSTSSNTRGGNIGDRRNSDDKFLMHHTKSWHKNKKESNENDVNNETQESLMPKEDLKSFCFFLSAIFTLGAAANFGRIYLMQTAGQQVINRLRVNVFGSTLKQEIGFFDRSKTGELVNRLSNDASLVGNSVTANISDGLRSIASASGGTAMMVYCSPKLTVLGLGIVPPVALIAVVYGRYLRSLTKKMNDALADSTQIAEERISNIRTVRSFGAEDKERKAYSQRIDSVLELAWRDALARGIFFGFTGLSGNLVMLSILFYGGNLVGAGEMSIGQLSSFLLYALYVGVSVGGLSGFYTELMRGLGASTRLFQIIERKPNIELSGGFIPPTLYGELKFENVSFAYPEREDAPILNNFKLEVPAGHVTAIVGPSGSGKSTLAALVLRFYDPQSGKIFIDKRRIETISLTWLRKHVAFVSQDPILFSTTIRENIVYGLQDASLVTIEQVKHAAAQANALEFIENFPLGFETVLGERGMTLSGGQRQRVAIARALMLDPKLLILDEATSALDSESEHLVQQALERLLKSQNRTVLIIAHRLSTVKNANQIAVLNPTGSVVELGSYAELMKIENGLFRKLVQKQTMAYDFD